MPEIPIWIWRRGAPVSSGVARGPVGAALEFAKKFKFGDFSVKRGVELEF